MPENIIEYQTKNKGEWTELYVFFRLLGIGKLYAADEGMNQLHNSYLNILKIMREDILGTKNNYFRREDKVDIYLNNELECTVEAGTFNDAADNLFHKIQTGRGRSFAVEDAENFMHSIYVYNVKDSSHKADIFLELRDSQTGYDTETGFSIKSDYQSKASLINASEATNFIYKLTGNMTDDIMNAVNAINDVDENDNVILHEDGSQIEKVKERLNYLREKQIELDFCDAYRPKCKKNLMRIDSKFPQILGEALKIYYYSDLNVSSDIINRLSELDPLGYEDDYAYMYKFKKLFTACSLGLNLGKNWDGLEEARGGIIIVKGTGDIIAYHVYNRNLFENFLINGTKFEHGGTTKHKYCKIYKTDNDYFIRLNLQIRYI